MPTEADIMGALRKADAAGDAASAQRFAAMLKTARQTPADRASAAGEQAGQNTSGPAAMIEGAADSGTFGLSNYLNAGARYAGQRLIGVQNPDSYDTDLAYVRGQQKGAAAAHPYSNITGQLAGTVLGAGPVSAVLKGASKVPGVISTVADAIGFQPAQTARNILRATGLGAFAGGVQAGNDTGFDPGQTTTGAAFGGAAGLGGVVAAPVIRKLAPAAVKANAMLAKIIGEDPGVIDAARQNFKAATITPTNPNGTEMPMAALMSLKQQGALRDLANANPDVGLALSNAHDDASAARPDRMADVLEGLMGSPQDINTLQTHVDSQMTSAMKPIRNQPVTVDQKDLELLTDPDVMASLRRNSPLRQKIEDAAQVLGSDKSAPYQGFDVNDMDNFRQSIIGVRNQAKISGNSHSAKDYDSLAESVESLVRDQVPAYGDALDDYRAGQNYIDSFQHGAAGKLVGDADTPSLRAALLSPSGAQGHSAGVATRLISGAGDSERGAVSAADALTQPGTKRLVAQTQTPAAAAGAARLGSAESRAAQALNAVAPSSIRSGDENSPQALLHGIAAATYHSPAGIAVHASKFLQALSGMKMSPAAQKIVARYLTDPSMSSQAYNIMRKAGNTDADIRRFATGLSASLGSEAGETTSRGQ